MKIYIYFETISLLIVTAIITVWDKPSIVFLSDGNVKALSPLRWGCDMEHNPDDKNKYHV